MLVPCKLTPAVTAVNVSASRYRCHVLVPDGDSDLAARLPHHSTRKRCSMPKRIPRFPECPNRHELIGANLVIDPDGSLHCVDCRTRRAANANPCVIEDCPDPVLARGWCRKHYLRWYKFGDTGTPPRFTDKQCAIDTCSEIAEKRGWCQTHYRRWQRTGTTDDPPAKPTECAFEGCAKKPTAKGYCKGHYKFVSRQGVEHEMRRYALKCGSQVGPVDYEAILAEFGMVCHICGGEIETRATLNFDHVIPLTRGGPHVQENIRPSHKRCNVRKGNKLMSELLAVGGGDAEE